MLHIQKTPLDEALSLVRTLEDPDKLNYYTFNVSIDDEFKCFINPIIKLSTLPILKDLPEGRYCIAGGVIRAIFNKEVPKDIDIFILGDSYTIQNTIRSLEKSLDIASQSVNIIYPEYTKHIELLNIPVTHLDGSELYTIQFIGQWFTGINTSQSDVYFKHTEDILETFDIVPICFGIELKVSDKDIEIIKVIQHPLCFRSLAIKELLVNDFGNSQFKRMRADRFYKYLVEYGFKIYSDEQMRQFNALLAYGSQEVDSEYV